MPDTSIIRPEQTPDGALSTLESILCLRDGVRTKRFAEAIAECVTQLEATTEGAIEVLDAGAGAIPFMSVYAALCSNRIHCTALELNPQSAGMAHQIVTALGLQDRIDIIETDATRYTPVKPVDLLISETMDSALTNEPMVRIMSNLTPAVRDGGKILPSGVKVLAGIVPKDAYTRPDGYVHYYYNPHHVVHPNWHPVADYTPGDRLDVIDFTLPFPADDESESAVAVASIVNLGSRVLNLYDSILTVPRYVRGQNGTQQFFAPGEPGQQVHVRYRPGHNLQGAGKVIEAA